MKSVAVIAALIALAAAPAMADKPKHAGKAPHGTPYACPPGLAKKNPPCVPPGLAKKDSRFDYRNGDIIRDGYVLLRDPYRYGLDPALTYWRVGEYLYRVDPDTGRVLAVLGLLSALLN